MKKALSLLLAIVMVALMIPFSVFMTSAENNEYTPAVELDESKYQELYSVDFTQIKNETELNEAKVYKALADGSTESVPTQYTENGLLYAPASTKSLNIGGVKFNAVDTYVVDFTMSYVGADDTFLNILNLQFGSGDAQAFVANKANRNKFLIRGPHKGLYLDTAWYCRNSSFILDGYKDDDLSVLNGAAVDAAKNGADIRFRVFVQGSKAIYAVLNIDGWEFYIFEQKSQLVVDSDSFFVFSSSDGEKNVNTILIKNLSIHKTPIAAPDIDMRHYHTLYSADLTKISSEAELNAASIYAPVKEGETEAYPSQYTENGLLFTLGSNKSLNFGGVKFNGVNNYVVDLTFSYVGDSGNFVQYLDLQYGSADPQAFVADKGSRNQFILTYQNNDLRTQTGWFCADSTFDDNNSSGREEWLAKKDAEASAAVWSGADVRVRVFVTGSTSIHAIINVGDSEFYMKEIKSTLSVVNDSFFVIATSNAEAIQNKILVKNIKIGRQSMIDLDEENYSPIYSVDFANINSNKELNSAGWYLATKDNAAEANPLVYTDNGIKYTVAGNKTLTFDEVAFDINKNYVLDLTYSYVTNPESLVFRFNSSDATQFSPDTGNKRTQIYVSSPETSGMQYPYGWYYTDHTYGTHEGTDTLMNIDPEAVEFAKTGDIRLRIFVVRGKATHLVFDIDGKQFYAQDPNSSLYVQDNSRFVIAAPGDYQDVAENQILLKSFSASTFRTKAPSADEMACVSIDGVNRYFAAGTTVNVADYAADAVAMKTNGVLGEAVQTINAEAGKTYALITKNDIASGKLTAADAELRLGANPGMRYKTSFAGSDFDLIMNLTALNTPAIVDVKMGTLVTVDTYLEGAGAFTADALKAYGEEIGKNVYMDITADAAALYAENTFAGSIISVKDFTRNYVARAYITVTFADATTATIYADATDAISIKGLAAAIVAAEYAGYETDAEKAALDFLATFGDVAA